MANVLAIGAEEIGDPGKESETKWITARQWPSPDTWPPFPGSLSNLVHGRQRQMDGWIDVRKEKYAVMPLHEEQVYHKKGGTCRYELLCHS